MSHIIIAEGTSKPSPDDREETVMPRSCELKKMIGLLVLCFGAGIFLSFILPWRLLAFI